MATSPYNLDDARAGQVQIVAPAVIPVALGRMRANICAVPGVIRGLLLRSEQKVAGVPESGQRGGTLGASSAGVRQRASCLRLHLLVVRQVRALNRDTPEAACALVWQVQVALQRHGYLAHVAPEICVDGNSDDREPDEVLDDPAAGSTTPTSVLEFSQTDFVHPGRAFSPDQKSAPRL